MLKIGDGLVLPENGNVFIDNQCYYKRFGLRRYNHIAYLSQSPFLPTDLTIQDLVKFVPNLGTVIQHDSVLEKLSKQKINTLSGGELRLLEIQILFCLDREYYLLDEPFTGMEPYLIENISNFLNRQKNLGKRILITDHYHRYVTGIVDSAYLLKNGYMEKLGKTTYIKNELMDKGYLPTR